MKKKSTPYIGITGYKRLEEIKAANEYYQKQGFLDINCSHKPMYGMVATSKNLYDTSVYGSQSPPLDMLENMCSIIPRGAITAIHYNVVGNGDIGEEITTLFKIKTKLYSSNLCRTVQINHMAWPKFQSIQYIRENLPDIEIILQIPRQVFSFHGSISQKIREVSLKVKEYEKLNISYILFDPSGGEGIEFNPHFAREMMSKLEEVLPGSTLGVAGGLSGDNIIKNLTSLNWKNKLFCIDATSHLYNKQRNGNFFSPNKIEFYLKKASVFFIE